MNAKNKGGHYSSGCPLPIVLFFLLLATQLFGQQINMRDAKETARIAVGLVIPDSVQIVTADVDMDGRILTYDAALIARYVLGLHDANCHCGKIVIINSKKYIIGDVYQEKRRKRRIEDAKGRLNVHHTK